MVCATKPADTRTLRDALISDCSLGALRELPRITQKIARYAHDRGSGTAT